MAKTNEELVRALLARKLKLQRQTCFDARDPSTRPTPAQHDFLYNFQTHRYHWIRAGNQSGKSASAGRLLAWIFEGSHPTFVRPKEWGDGPLTIIVMTRTASLAEENNWGNKMRPLLDPAEYHEIRIAGVLKKVIHEPTGNTIIFQTFHSEIEARDKAQGFVAHFVWLDEMPRTAKLVEELQRRVSSLGGYFIGTFTPKGVSSELQKLVDSPSEFKRVHRFRMFDNPMYADNPQRQAEVLAEIASFPPSYQKTILEGDWSQGDGVVIQFDPDLHMRAPEGYSPSWRHVEISDPATQSKQGLMLVAQSPHDKAWYVVKSDYIMDVYTPSLIVAEVIKRTRNLNIIRRVYDSASSWYANEARAKGLKYFPVENKSNRKMETIAKTQQALGTNLFVAPWCEELIDEMNSCVWADPDSGKIANPRKYHLMDCLRYFVDTRPRDEVEQVAVHRDVQIQMQWREEQDKRQRRTAPMQRQRAFVLPSRRW